MIGVRLVAEPPIPTRMQTDDYIGQSYIRGAELSVALIAGGAGMPLRILLPEGTPYSFLRKYLLRPSREPVRDRALAGRVQDPALEIAAAFEVNWAARIDLMHETTTGRLRFLECDVAPLVGARSAFAASLEAAGITRAEQLRLLLQNPGGTQ